MHRTDSTPPNDRPRRGPPHLRVAAAATAALLSTSCIGEMACLAAAAGELAANDHMVAEATLAAHFVDAALAAGRTPEQINQVLAAIAAETAVEEFWISDESGVVVFSSVAGVEFTFPTDPGADTQSAPFAALLTGAEEVVMQDPAPRELDGELFVYVGVAGVDQPRIMQVGRRALPMEACEGV